MFFSNSGAEANKAAFKLARYYSLKKYNLRNNRIISFYNSFHGRTFFTVSVGGKSKYSNDFGPKPSGILHSHFNDIDSIKKIINHNICFVVVELIQVEGGIVPEKVSFIEDLKTLCDKYNSLLIFNEVQTGIGRTGKLFAYEYYNVNPDILTLAKSLRGGFPIGATLMIEKIASFSRIGIHSTTYGGNSLAYAASETVIDIINTKKVLCGVEKKFQKIIYELNIINKRFELFSEIRGRGLLIGIVLKPNFFKKIYQILNTSFLEGAIFLTAGDNVIRLTSSLIISEFDIHEGMQRFYRALEKSFL